MAKILPPILGLITSIYVYLFTLEILPIGICGFFSSLFITQLIWLNDDLVSATPRAFLYPLFAAFLYYLSQNKLIPCLVLMLLQGLFYPQLLLIEVTIITLVLFENNGNFLIKLLPHSKIKTKIKREPFCRYAKRYPLGLPSAFCLRWWILGLIVTAIALYPITQKAAELATVVSAQQMQQMPEFNLDGRSPFFGGGWLDYWFTGSSGLNLPIFPTIIWLGVALPWLLKTKLPVINLITQKIAILKQITIASLLMFLLAHLLLPRLHLPSRYTYHSLRFVLAIATSIVITILFDLGKTWVRKKIRANKSLTLSEKIKITLITLFSFAIIIVPAVPYVFIYGFQNWRVGTNSEIYEYLAEQPKDIIVASLSKEINNIPAFTQRSILVGEEFALAYHPSYYNQVQQRVIALIQAQYSPDIEVLKSLIQQYDVDYLLLDNTAFTTEYLLDNNWLMNSSWSDVTRNAIADLESGSSPILLEFVKPCSVLSTEDFNLLNIDCVLQQKGN
ncbi:hypothetical protein Xen7305DRAFT_00005470 [Xenococcus sp. PCC 7305]|uniref:hypothetical protein n=1 Tax=Xenococcus sp. PCC 7305 TaxID=102125 RepID=UPI0002ABEFB1|nr:hypothetical protein [Xenococcus sp. PCC 7305]ELS00846.1 hypothetical protein Xen7305DRAFT_00005470 [Xenococcus sp. PCC 7305]